MPQQPFTNWIISAENREYLKNLPEQIQISCNGLKTMIVHVSPGSIDEYLFEKSNRIIKIYRCRYYYLRAYPYTISSKIGDKHFINAGSVVKPKHVQPQATYVVVSIEANRVACEIVKADYDVTGIIKAIETNKMILNKLIQMLEKDIRIKQVLK